MASLVCCASRTKTDEPPSQVAVLSLSEARKAKRLYPAVLSVHDTETRHSQRLAFHRNPRPAHLTLLFDDLECVEQLMGRPGRLPEISHVEETLAFARENPGRLLVHCHAGKARSAALAVLVLADRLGSGREMEAFLEMLRTRPQAVPNGLLVILSDQVLGREGRLTAAYQSLLDARSDWQEHKRRHAAQFKMS